MGFPSLSASSSASSRSGDVVTNFAPVTFGKQGSSGLSTTTIAIIGAVLLIGGYLFLGKKS